MMMLAIDCRKQFPGSHDVWANGKEVSNVFAVYALWNGGPGIIGYFPETAGGRFYITDGVVATAWRLSWSVRIAPRLRA